MSVFKRYFRIRAVPESNDGTILSEKASVEEVYLEDRPNNSSISCAKTRIKYQKRDLEQVINVCINVL